MKKAVFWDVAPCRYGVMVSQKTAFFKSLYDSDLYIHENVR
jgi:hypothetical protein